MYLRPQCNRSATAAKPEVAVVSSPPSRYRPDPQRSNWLLGVLLAGFLLILAQLINIQILRHNFLMEKIAPMLESRSADVIPYPGAILARNGESLAESVLLTAIIADPARMLENRESFRGVAEQLAPLVNRPAEEILGDLTARETSHYLEIARYVKQDRTRKIKKLCIKGLALLPEWKREYPQGTLACHVLGGRDRFHKPLSGLELQYRLLLDGAPGSNRSGGDPLGLASSASAASMEPLPGKDLVLTIDAELQRQAENELDRMYDRETPKWASVVVMDPRTGGILAMAARPGYDPSLYVTGKPAPGHRWASVPAEATRNIPVTEAVEPGSTFKVLLAAAALEDGAITPSSSFHCSGHINIGGQPISCWGKYAGQGHGTLTVAGMLAQSCNICAAQIALRLGAPRYYAFLRKCGIGQDPQAGFPAEEFGLMALPEKMRSRDLATMGFGQNVSCTGLQLTSIVSGIVNGGIMKHPHIVDRVLTKDGSVFRQLKVSEQRVCSEQTSALIRQMMQYTVEKGTGKPAAMPDFKVGAKTGTAQQWDLANKRHFSDRYMVSFLEIAPAEAPRYVVYVACNEPKVGKHGSDVCGPVSKRIVEYALRHLDRAQVPPVPVTGG
jgi:stage V sporulation protein D (sporulation-specific penicillin-binding protein)